jgi:hypothetical protein
MVTVDYFGAVLLQHIKADNLMGPHHLVEVVRAQTKLLDEILPRANSSAHADLLELAYRYNEYRMAVPGCRRSCERNDVLR